MLKILQDLIKFSSLRFYNTNFILEIQGAWSNVKFLIIFVTCKHQNLGLD